MDNYFRNENGQLFQLLVAIRMVILGRAMQERWYDNNYQCQQGPRLGWDRELVLADSLYQDGYGVDLHMGDVQSLRTGELVGRVKNTLVYFECYSFPGKRCSAGSCPYTCDPVNPDRCKYLF